MAWFKTDVIIGNPPFIGAKLLKPKLGVGYINRLRKAYPEIPGMADLCVYWFRRAQDELRDCTRADVLSGRGGLVGTQNVRSNASRIGGLDHIAATSTIVDAVDNQPWSGEANVNVSIVNWVKTQDDRLLPKKRRLWFKVEESATGKMRKRGSGPASKHYGLNMRDTSLITSSLSDEVDVSLAEVLKINENVVVCQGITTGHSGFVLSPEEHAAMIRAEPKSAKVLHPYMVGDDVLSNDGKASRWLIDFGESDVLHAQSFHLPFDRLKTTVLPKMKSAAAAGTSERATSINHWWQHWRPRSELISAIALMPRYLVCSRVTKRPIFAFVSSLVRPGDALQAFALDDDYSFGVLQAAPHWKWFVAKSSKLTERLRYTSESVFNTFPWPQSPTAKQVQSVAEAGRKIRRIRANAIAIGDTSIRMLYRTLDLDGKNPLKDAHAELDAAVLDAYGFSGKKDLLLQLLSLNKAVASSKSKKVTGPGIPPVVLKPQTLISNDSLGV